MRDPQLPTIVSLRERYFETCEFSDSLLIHRCRGNSRFSGFSYLQQAIFVAECKSNNCDYFLTEAKLIPIENTNILKNK